MKKIIIVLMLILAAAFCFAEENSIRIKTGEWFEISIPAPEAKIGGGEYFSVKAEFKAGNEEALEVTADTPVTKIRALKTGRYKIILTLNRLTKGSCAGITAKPVYEKEIVIDAY